MIRKESENLPSCDYLKRLRNGKMDVASRDEVLDWIAKESKSWMMQLLAVACLSIAAKMAETDVPLSLDLQTGDSKYVFEGRTIQRMKLLVLTTLKWRMQAVTPFSFMDYYLTKINSDRIASCSSIVKCTELILSTLKGINFIEFKPSEIAAAAVAISVAVENEVVDIEKAICSLTPQIQKERVMRCAEAMQEFSSPSGFLTVQRTSHVSVPNSPILLSVF
ncbi:unnamed protein product [Cuscuta epithymum]|uniref:Cyclin C-terminal domain-containing protein n=1 Tax=Cuscuta epithymum TaxID=186058 RepID=A0AAV0DHV3_9ASTE|nr:unnamed protein product [Cuscuta epithymum]